MISRTKLFRIIKDTVVSIEPTASLILFGSYARNENKKDSDVDLLILLDRSELTRNDVNRIKYPLYDIEFETGKIISPIVFTKDEWQKKHSITPFFENVSREGILL